MGSDHFFCLSVDAEDLFRLIGSRPRVPEAVQPVRTAVRPVPVVQIKIVQHRACQQHVQIAVQMQAFVDAINNDTEVPLTSFDDAFKTHKAIFAADLSAKLGRPVKLSELD